jgi:tRNA-binding protein
MIAFEDFAKLEIRVGRVLAVERLPNPRYTTHKLTVDFGLEIGRKVSGARLIRYTDDQLVGRLILGVLNLPRKQIGGMMSEFLTLGVPDGSGECVLIEPDSESAVLGGRLY